MSNTETVHRYWRAWTEHKLADILSLLSTDFVSRSSLSQGQPVGKAMIAQGFQIFDKALPNLKEDVVSTLADGDRVVCEVVETATFSGPMELP
jgi:ketosteroid isomerase-like protein